MFAGKTSELLRRTEEHEARMPASSGRTIMGCCMDMRREAPCMLTCPSTAHAQAAGWQVAVVKSTVDNRYHKTRVVSHDGKSKVHAWVPFVCTGVHL